MLTEAVLPDGTVQFGLRPSGPMLLEREFREAAPVGNTDTYEPAPSPDAPATVISRDGVPLGELTDIALPELTRVDYNAHVLGTLRRAGTMSFRVDFRP